MSNNDLLDQWLQEDREDRLAAMRAMMDEMDALPVRIIGDKQE